MQKRSFTGASVGTSSILVVFVLLCLTTFATLSLVSANADYALSQNTAQAAKSYYDADLLAEIRLAEIDRILLETAENADSRLSYFDACAAALEFLPELELFRTETGGLQMIYVIEASETSELFVKLEALYPPEDGAGFRRLAWNSRSTVEWETDDGMNLWDGDMTEDMVIIS